MKSKQCYTCKRTRLSKFFHRKGNGYQSACKDCKKSYHRQHYLQNKEKYVDQKNARKKNMLAFVNKLKRDKPCVDCRGVFHPVCLDFDHLPGTEKLDSVASLANNGYSKKVLLAEIAKCELVCSNCHRYRTHVSR